MEWLYLAMGIAVGFSGACVWLGYRQLRGFQVEQERFEITIDCSSDEACEESLIDGVTY